jgi:ubiquinone/menaquinone biosynthesis C-methylase UbiE
MTATSESHEPRVGWDKIAPSYDAFVTPTNFGLAAEVLRRAGLRPGMRLLDVAAGSGAVSLAAARLRVNVIAVDISPMMIEQLMQRARQEHLNVEAHVMDGQALDLNADSFDMTASEFGVMLFPDLPSGLREMTRVTKSGGRVVVVALGSPTKIEFLQFFIRAVQAVVSSWAGPPLDPLPLPFQLQDPEKLRREMVEAGLKDVRVEETSEEMKYESGKHFWDCVFGVRRLPSHGAVHLLKTWVTNSNPLAGALLKQFNLTEDWCSEPVATVFSLLVRPRAPGVPMGRRQNYLRAWAMT